MMCSLTFLQLYHSDGQHRSQRYRGRHLDSPLRLQKQKKATMDWKHPRSSTARKFKITPSESNVMITIFWDSCGVILIDYLELCHFDKVARSYPKQTAGHV
ncbi:hypothetical protein TNCT_646501 [Trichonephila clavata]|uniref:Uncharacterized protein n=1 Tax=Trichonephila clavata TaxID=2740835 RepID=A0A8X6HPB3_TRICU|nr:hypothetical protein TNCT_646501 [Trichonephila clavata]